MHLIMTSGAKWASFCVRSFAFTLAPNTLQSSASLYLSHKLPTQPFWGSKQGQQQDHINQIITESSGTEAIGTLTSHFPSNLSLANSLHVFVVPVFRVWHFLISIAPHWQPCVFVVAQIIRTSGKTGHRCSKVRFGIYHNGEMLDMVCEPCMNELKHILNVLNALWHFLHIVSYASAEAYVGQKVIFC